jgi:hypothetical protein
MLARFALSLTLALLVFTRAEALSLSGVQVGVISLQTNDLISDPQRNLIYASVPSTAGPGLGNTITTIQPTGGTIGPSTFVGSEPNALAISSDASAVYVGLDGAAAVARWNPATGVASPQFALGSSSFTGPYFAEDIAVVPGDPNSIAVSRRNQGFSPRHEGVAIYTNGSMMPNTTANHTGSNRIEFSDDPSLLLGYNNETTEYGFRRMAVNSSGVSVTNTTQNVIQGFGVDIEYDAGRIYATSGRVVDPTTSTILGTFASSGLVEAVPSLGVVFFLEGTSGSIRTLKMFDLGTYVLLDSKTISGISGTPSSLISWGDSGLAFRTSGSQVYLISSIPEPGSGALFGGGLIAFAARRRKAGV